jgi:triphosphoribosyl-dephospho-CoA synthase
MNETFIARAFRSACVMELRALKPGNVHVHAAGHGMTVEDFARSADAAAPYIAMRGASVGARISRSVDATIAAVGRNTNLGIVLLSAPLASAAALAGRPLRLALSEILDALDVEDANLAFTAIRRANPAGLGSVEANDVHAPARVTLLEAMRQAADRDLVARQYVTVYRDVFALGLPALMASKRGLDDPWAVTCLYLAFLTTLPDSHIARKYGHATAVEVMDCVRAFTIRRVIGPGSEADLLALDAELKAAGLNPGTTADLTVATLFAAALQEAALPRIRI